MADLNQGASIEAERRDFEEWAELTDHQKRGAQHEVVGWYYFDELTNDRWEAWQASAALRTPAAPAGARATSVKTWRQRAIELGEKALDPKTAYGLLQAEIDELRNVLAAKGQGMPNGYTVKHVEGQGWIIDAPKSGRWIAFDDTPAGELLADLAAPAGAQPADPMDWPLCQSEEVQQQVADQVHRELYSGAQPDRGAAPDSESFASWLAREMPAGTVIADPAWWAPRIQRAALNAATEGANQKGGA